MRIIAISDTHEFHRRLTIPAGDILVHCGDITNRGDIGRMRDFSDWLGEQPHQHKIVIAGNHDFSLDRFNGRLPKLDPYELFAGIATYLEGESYTIDDVKFWGGPWVPNLPMWAFPERGNSWDHLPEDTQILVTHGPPRDILDSETSHYGSAKLRNRIFALPRLKAHFFGHVHEGYGRERHLGVDFINAATCDRMYQPVNRPQVYDL